MTRIKFCGLSRPCDIEEANALAVDYIGFIFAAKSRRYVTPEKAAELKSLLDPGICAVGVFVNEEPDLIANLARDGVFGAVQLHGAEDEEYIRILKELLPPGMPVIRAVGADRAAALIKAGSGLLVPGADMLLADSPGGGTGESFDWSLLEQYLADGGGSGMAEGVPFILAGGLDADNAGEAVRRFHPYALDVSSGIETDGVKDPGKMRRFAAAVRRADAEEMNELAERGMI